jgi:hypothetical protein
VQFNPAKGHFREESGSDHQHAAEHSPVISSDDKLFHLHLARRERTGASARERAKRTVSVAADGEYYGRRFRGNPQTTKLVEAPLELSGVR